MVYVVTQHKMEYGLHKNTYEITCYLSRYEKEIIQL